MPLPRPIKDEPKTTFIGRCMSDEGMKKEFSDSKQRTAVCNSQFSKGKKESRFTHQSIIEVKEDDSLVVKGYIATTHFDGQDVITKTTLDRWADEINSGIPRANKVSINHNRVPHVAGRGIEGTAVVKELPDGEFGLYVETIVDKTREDYAEIKYRVENGFLDSFSIEYIAPEETAVDSKTGARVLDENTELWGWTLASQPMNENAVMIKELFKEEDNMVEEETKPEVTEEKVEDTVQEKPKEEVAEEKEEKMSEEDMKKKKKAEMEKAAKKKMKEVSDEDYQKLVKVKEMEAKEDIKKEILLAVKEDFSKELESLKVETKTKINSEEIEDKEIKEFKEALESKDPSFGFKMAGKMVNKIGGLKTDTKNIYDRALTRSAEGKFNIVNNRLEMKGLGITTNQNSDTDYLLSSAELADVFDPVIYNYLNQKVTTWNILPKDDYSMTGNNQVQFTVKTTANTTASAYTGNAVNLGNVGRKKYMTKFKKYQVGIEVDGDMIAAARGGPIGDVFAQEVKDSTDDLMEVMNAALFAEVGLETASGVIGFEYITDSAGNGTLYNIDRSGDSYLAPTSASDTYINGSSANITKAKLREAIRNAIEEGAGLDNLVFVCSPIQYDKIKELYDDHQRYMTNMARFGFEAIERMSFEGVPVFFDKDCNDDDIFLIDTETHRIGMWVPPTVERLGKDSDSEKAFIKTYFCTYNRCPNRMVQIYSLATS